VRTFEHVVAAGADRDLAVGADLQRAVALVALIGHAGGAAGERLHTVLIAGKEVTAGAIAGIGQAQQGVEFAAQFDGQRPAVLRRQRAVAGGNRQRAHVLQRFADLRQCRLGQFQRALRESLVARVLLGQRSRLFGGQRTGCGDRSSTAPAPA
jgi:hypothetical protein